MNKYAEMISELKTPELMKHLTYLYGQRDGHAGSANHALYPPAQKA